MDYIKLNRKILDWEWYGDINTCRLFIHMLLRANWKPGRFQGVEVSRGSFVSSISKLSAETSLSVREVRTALSHLEQTGEVTHKGHAKYSVFTVKNYDLYQTSDTLNDKQETSKRQTKDKQSTTIEEKKEGKKGRREEVINMSSGTSADRTPEYPYKAVIDYLNTKLGTRYLSSSKDTRKHIRDRCDDGFKYEDFVTVIDKKVREWKGTQWEKFLRPETLFGNKFESYLNQTGRNGSISGGNKFNNFQPRDYDYTDMEKTLLEVDG